MNDGVEACLEYRVVFLLTRPMAPAGHAAADRRPASPSQAQCLPCDQSHTLLKRNFPRHGTLADGSIGAAAASVLLPLRPARSPSPSSSLDSLGCTRAPAPTNHAPISTVSLPRLITHSAFALAAGDKQTSRERAAARRMDRYRIAPARPVCLSAAGVGVHLRPAAPSGRRSSGAEIGIFTAERYFSAADVGRRDAAMIPAPALPDHRDHELPPRLSVPAVADAASQSGRTVASSEASWNSRSGLLSAGHLAAARQETRSVGACGASVCGSDHQGYRGRRTGGGGSAQRWTLFGRDCPCAGRKAVTVDFASEPRSPAAAAHFHAKFSPQCAIEECLESAIFKVKHPSPPLRAATTEEEEEPTKVKVTVTPGSRAFPLAAADNGFAAVPSRSTDVPFAALSNADIDRRVLSSGGLTFPALGAGRVVSGGGGDGVLDEPRRVSLEVFRPIDEDSVMLADPPPAAVPLAGRVGLLPRAPPAVAALVVDEEAMSDASSDLFDLESFAASSSYPTTYRGRVSRRNSADDDPPYVSAAAAAEPALSECMYPASEASVVWSVATAEGGAFDAASVANFSSAASACCVDELRYVVPESPEARFTAAMSRSSRWKKSGGGGFLSSCRCEKAVSVGPTPVRVVRPPAHPGAAAKRSGDGGASRYHHHGRAHVPVRT